MAKGCLNFSHLDEEYYPDHHCVSAGIEPPCHVCAVTAEIPRLEALVSTLKARLFTTYLLLVAIMVVWTVTLFYTERRRAEELVLEQARMSAEDEYYMSGIATATSSKTPISDQYQMHSYVPGVDDPEVKVPMSCYLVNAPEDCVK